MRRWCLIAVGLAASLSAHAAEPVVIEPGEERYALLGALEILEDPQKQWTIEDVASASPPGAFQSIDQIPHHIGISDAAYWLRFTVSAASGELAGREWVLASYERVTDSIQLFRPTPDGWRKRRAGYRYSGENATPLALPLELPTAGSRTFYLRVESRDFILLDLDLRTADSFRKGQTWQHLWHGGFFGLMDLMLLLNGLLFLLFKGRSYLYYLGYLASLSVYLFFQNGYLDWALTPPLTSTWLFLHGVLIGLVVLFIVLFTRSFLKTRDSTPRMDKFLVGYMIAAALTVVTTPFASATVAVPATIALGMLAPFGTILPGVLRLRQGFQPARLYLVAWGVVGLGAFLFAMPIDLPMHGHEIFQVACLLNAWLVTVALVDQLRRYRDQRATAVEAQRVSEELYRTIFDNTGTSMITFDDDTTISLANEEWAKLVDCPLDEMVGKKSWTEFFTEESLARMKSYHEQRSVDPSSIPRAYEAQVRSRTGKVHDGIITIAVVPGTKMRVSSFQDLTDLKRAQQQMYRADKMAALGQIIAGVAHEINNPNNFIVFNIPILKRYVEAIKPLLDDAVKGLDDPKILNMPYEDFVADVFKLLENMAHGSSRITEIVADLKSYVGGHDEDKKQVEPLEPVIDRVMTLVGKQVRKTVKIFDVDAADDLPPVLMNAGRIEQVLINLIINAGQAVDKDDSRVALAARHSADDDAWIEIIVEDNGSGIPQENIDKIFDPFFTSKGRGEGTGLGLAISQQIIEDHGGTLAVSSTPGEGTCFTLRLPVHDGGNA